MSLLNRTIPTEDRVSSLPDSIISYILSFLPTKSAAATSVLSKRWNPLWLSILDLDFNGKSFKDYFSFRHAIFTAMLRRDMTLPIRSFCLKYCGYNINNPTTDINVFINAAIQRRIETLDFDMWCWDNGFQLSRSIFSCKTLTVLKLRFLKVNDLPPQVNIPLLKILDFEYVFFTCHTPLFKFLLGCPSLEELQISKVGEVHWKESIQDLQRITTIKCLPNLVRANVDSIIVPLFFFSTTQILRVKVRWPFIISQVPIFHNLTQMELFFFSNIKVENWGRKWSWMQHALQCSPKLQHLTITMPEEMENGIYEDDWKDLEVIPECLLSQLRTCLFRDCRGTKCELQFAEYVMRNSKVLRTITIHTAFSLDLNVKNQMLQKLSVCPRGCKLIFD